MKCPKCGEKSRTVTTGWVIRGERIMEKDGKTKRRRECLECKHRWTTMEIAADKLKEKEDIVEEVEEINLTQMIMDFESVYGNVNIQFIQKNDHEIEVTHFAPAKMIREHKNIVPHNRNYVIINDHVEVNGVTITDIESDLVDFLDDGEFEVYDQEKHGSGEFV